MGLLFHPVLLLPVLKSWAPTLVPSGLPPDLSASILPLQIFLPFPRPRSSLFCFLQDKILHSAHVLAPVYVPISFILLWDWGAFESLPLCFLALSSVPGYLLNVSVLPHGQIQSRLYLGHSLPAPHPTVYMTPVSDYNTISHSQAWWRTSVCCRSFFYKKQNKTKQDQFIRMHCVDSYRTSRSHFDNRGISGCSFILENDPVDSHVNTLAFWSVAPQTFPSFNAKEMPTAKASTRCSC